MSKKTKIVINALQYKSNSSGIGIMMKEWFGPFTEVTRRNCEIVIPKNNPEFNCSSRVKLIEAPYTYDEGIKRIAYQSFRLGSKYCNDAILLTVDSKVPFILPKNCHVVPIVTDLALFRMGEAYQISRVLLWKKQYKYLRKRAERFIAISEFTKSEMMDILGIPSEKIDVIPCAASEKLAKVTDEDTLAKVRKHYNLNKPYILFIGSLNPRKNLERLIQAFDKMKNETDLPHELVIAGGLGWKFDESEVFKDVKAKDAIHSIGYVSDEYKAALYSAAELFAFPTLYEGFGIPVIEAQQCGTAVLTSNVSSLPEVGGDAAEYVNPYDVDDISAEMTKLLKDNEYREALVEKGYLNAKQFSWERSAVELNEVIEKIIAQQD